MLKASRFREKKDAVSHSNSAPADFDKRHVEDKEINGIEKAENSWMQTSAAAANGKDNDPTEVRISATLGEWRQLRGMRGI